MKFRFDLIIAITIVALGVIVGLTGLIICTKEHNKVVTYPLIQIKNSYQQEGKWFLFLGTLNGNIGYSAYIKNNDSIELINIPSDRVKIYENAAQDNARVQIKAPKLKNESKYMVYVPQGSIKYNIDLNLKDNSEGINNENSNINRNTKKSENITKSPSIPLFLLRP